MNGDSIMNHSKSHSVDRDILIKLERLYQSKCMQVEKAKAISNSLMYKVLKAEADNIKSAIDQC